MYSQQSLLRFLFCSFIFGSLSSHAHGLGDSFRKLTPVQYTMSAGVLFTAASFWRLFYKDPSPDAKPRYNVNQILDMQLLRKNPKAFWENCFYLYDDGIVGQYYKNNTITVTPDKEIKLNKKCLPFGILGRTVSYIEVTHKAQKTFDNLVKIMGTAAAVYAYNNPEKFFNFITGKTENKEKENNNAGVPIADLNNKFNELILALSRSDTIKVQLKCCKNPYAVAQHHNIPTDVLEGS